VPREPVKTRFTIFMCGKAKIRDKVDRIVPLYREPDRAYGSGEQHEFRSKLYICQKINDLQLAKGRGSAHRVAPSLQSEDGYFLSVPFCSAPGTQCSTCMGARRQAATRKT
jgi:hypothetical protein